ncbi:hypothetical protein CYLTODRAFT_433121 [Cylindrobasidium torrendii FP15055 ss-10]|uniref:DUF3074 domain-containing protein n=1 Tax=Cylindrobasidium torrendii FP15055 ss-10 TaxID=1314674 RepID=A0A0D7B0K2_9AGAR|nr:hypothetical protein CYLTODRAFT_433121 [Cylindrobasidium torrendii FP15055 ss-10]
MQQTSPVLLSLKPTKPSEIPSEDLILAAGRELINSTTSWKHGKTFHKTVKTLYRSKREGDGAHWHCRVSVHDPADVTFDQVWSKLGADKALHEKEFIPDIDSVTKVQALSPTATIWSLHYKFSSPVSPRVFTVLQVVHISKESPRVGLITSIPIDLSDEPELAKLEADAIRGRYVSVERLQELEDGRFEWRMATSSTPGGNIPAFLVESTMPSKIAEDVPHFMKWLKAQA